MKTKIKINYKLRSKRIYSRLIKKGMFEEASRLLRALNNGIEWIRIDLSDRDWNLSAEFGREYFGAKEIRIK